MSPSLNIRTLVICLGAIAAVVPAHADQELQPGVSVRATNIDADGKTVILSGDVLIAGHVVLKSDKKGLSVLFSDNQTRPVTISPFDVKSETVTPTADGFTLADNHGHTVRIYAAGKLPEAPVASTPPTPVPTSTPAAVAVVKPASTPAANPSTAPTNVTIVQTAPQAEKPHKKQRYVDPVTDRGAVIP